MPNLRILYMYNKKWTLDPTQILQAPDDRRTSLRIKTGSKTKLWPSSLKQLQLGSNYDNFYGLTPILLFARFPSALESLTSLEFDWPSFRPPDELLRMLGVKPVSRLLHCPQLQHLKIRNPTLEILQHFSKPEGQNPKLKELSLNVSCQELGRSAELLRGLIPLLDIHSGSLVSFTLEIAKQNIHRGLPPFFFSETGVSFLHLKEVALRTSTLWWSGRGGRMLEYCSGSFRRWSNSPFWECSHRTTGPSLPQYFPWPLRRIPGPQFCFSTLRDSI